MIRPKSKLEIFVRCVFNDAGLILLSCCVAAIGGRSYEIGTAIGGRSYENYKNILLFIGFRQNKNDNEMRHAIQYQSSQF